MNYEKKEKNKEKIVLGKNNSTIKNYNHYIICEFMNTTMALRNEYPEKYDWWLSELESLSRHTIRNINPDIQARFPKYLFAQIKTM